MMTLKVYKINRDDGTVQVLRPEVEVAPLAHVEATEAYPKCECEQCKGER